MLYIVYLDKITVYLETRVAKVALEVLFDLRAAGHKDSWVDFDED